MRTTARYLLSFSFLFVSICAFAAGHTVTITLDHHTCDGDNSGQATANVTGGTGPFTYAWNDPGSTTSQTLMNAIAGSYTVTVTDQSDGSTATANCTIANNFSPTPSSNSNSPVCEGETLNLFTTAMAGGTYSWSGPSFSSTLQNPSISSVTPAMSGTYTVTVVDAFGCSGTSTTSVVINPNPTVSISPAGPFCEDDNTPYSLSASPFGGVFSGSGITNISGTFVPATVGFAGPVTINYTVTDPNGCIGTNSTIITINPLPSATINANITSGDAPLMVMFSTDSGMSSSAWDFGDGSSATDLGTGSVMHTYNDPGTYSVTLTNTLNGCTNTATSYNYVTVNSTGSIIPTFTTPAAVCQGATPPYPPTISNNSITGTWTPATFSTASAGVSVLTFTPDPGQSATTTTLMLTINAPITPTFPTPAAVCQGATPPAHPNPSNEGINGTWTPTLFSTATPGTSCATFTPTAGQCATTAVSCLTVNAQSTPTFNQIPPLCVGDVSPTLQNPSNEGFTGTWNPSVVTTMAPGAYTYSFTPTAGMCASFATMTVIVGPQAIPNFSAMGPICAGPPAPALQNPDNQGIFGTWSPSTINTATPGVYTYTFTPSAGICASSATFTVEVTSGANITISPSGTVTTCPDVPITLVAAGGTAYTWTPSIDLSTSTGPVVVANPSVGTTYTVEGVDANGCVGSATVTVTIGTELTVQINPSSTSLCEGGSVVLSAFGATDYTWSPPTGLNATIGSMVTVSGLTTATTYTVTGTTGSCSGTTSIVVTPVSNPVVSATSTDVTCASICNGTISTTATGVGPFGYGWTGPTGIMGDPNPTGLCAGEYIVMITDNNGCSSAPATVVVGAPSTISAILVPTMPTSCTACDGYVNNTVTGGAAPYVYSWTGPGSGWVNDDAVIEGVCNGVYELLVTDASGCSETFTVELESDNIEIVVTGTADNCGAGTGSASAAVTGATGNITYHWSPGDLNTESIFALSGGTYTVTVTDEAGCEEIGSVTIANTNAPAVYASSTASACSSATGSITAIAGGGVAPYQFALNGGAFSSSATFTGISQGTYTVYTKDATGCIGSTTAIVGNTSSMYGWASITPASCVGSTNGSATAMVNGGTAPYTYLWSTGSTLQTINNVPAGNYTCVVTDNTGCQTTIVGNVYTGGFMTLYFDSDFDDCGTAELTAEVYNFYNPSPPYTYAWSNGATTQTITGIPAGYYTVTVTDAAGCSTNGYYTVYDYDYSYITGKIYLDENANCVPDAGDTPIHGWIKATAPGGQVYQGYAYSNGEYSVSVPSGAQTYAMSFNPYGFYNSPYYTLNCPVADVTLGPNCDNEANVNFGFSSVPAQDLAISVYCETARPGFSQINSLTYFNPGTTEMDGTVKLDLDPLLYFYGATPTPTLVSGNHIEWDFTDLGGTESGTINFYTGVPTIENGGTLGTILHNTATVEPLTGDLTPEDNVYTCDNEIVGSYDPNMKEVYSPQAHSSGAIDSAGAEMYYTVHFQNTGTDTAFTIVVRDTLSQHVDIATLELLGSSHHYTWSILPGRCLEVRFEHILLVDSNKNEPMSHGYFNYRIRTNDHLPLGAQIDNTAGIYFDFNPPVITNTVSSPVVAFANVDEKPGMEAVVYPNPNNTGSVRVKLNGMSYNEIEFRLTDANGRTVRNNDFSHTALFDVDLNGLQNGIYFYSITNESGDRSIGKLMIVK